MPSVLVGQRHPSGDFIAPDLAREIVEALPDSVCGVLVSHLEDPGALLELIDQVKPRALQIHSPMAISAVHGSNGNAMETLQAYAELVDGFVSDSCNPATGQVGGLTAGNVSEAIVRVQPYGVDVNSGVKGADGLKERARLQAFVQRAKTAKLRDW
jgi:phosphoribosylanthranilate isomerase